MATPMPPAQWNGDALARRVAKAQGAYYASTGVWSLVDADSFQKVTGPKKDVWLVKTVGVLVTALGAGLWQSGRDEKGPSRAVGTIAVGSAAGLAAIDVFYVLKRRISPVYLLDAVAEAGLIGAWLVARRTKAAPA